VIGHTMTAHCVTETASPNHGQHGSASLVRRMNGLWSVSMGYIFTEETGANCGLKPETTNMSGGQVKVAVL